MRARKPSSPPPFVVGARVKPSSYALRPLYDRMVEYVAGSGSPRAQREEDYRRACARRGTVTDVGPDASGYSWALGVAWDGGAPSRCLSYMVEPATREGGAS